MDVAELWYLKMWKYLQNFSSPMLLMLYKFCKGKKYTEILGKSDDSDSSKKSISWLIQIYFAVCWLCFEVSKLFFYSSLHVYSVLCRFSRKQQKIKLALGADIKKEDSDWSHVFHTFELSTFTIIKKNIVATRWTLVGRWVGLMTLDTTSSTTNLA